MILNIIILLGIVSFVAWFFNQKLKPFGKRQIRIALTILAVLLAILAAILLFLAFFVKGAF